MERKFSILRRYKPALSNNVNLLSGFALAAFLLALLLFLLLKFFWREQRDAAWYQARQNDRDGMDAAGKRLPRYGPAPFPINEGQRGDPHTCPVCAARFEHGETIRSKIFPQTNRNDRLLHISGCPYCLNGERRRECPVCGAELTIEEYLIARIYERYYKSHVHVTGCNRCCGPGRQKRA